MKKTSIDFHPNKRNNFYGKQMINVNMKIINEGPSATQEEKRQKYK